MPIFEDLRNPAIQPRDITPALEREFRITNQLKTRLQNELMQRNETRVNIMDSTTSILQRGNNIVFPNQYFAVAAMCYDIASELIKYCDFFDDNVRNNPQLIEALKNHNYEDQQYVDLFDDDNDREMFTLFLRDRNFRPGKEMFDSSPRPRQSKEILGSCVLKKVSLPDSSSGYLGDLIYYLSRNLTLYRDLKDAIMEQIANANNAAVNQGEILLYQQIFYGAPGTGKSYKIDDPENGCGLKNVNNEFKFRTTFHPDYDYAQFVGSYKPIETPNTPILNKDDLSRELRRFMAEERPNPVHKFASCYFKSLKKLSAEEKSELFGGAAIPESVQSTEVPKAISIAGFLDKRNNSSSITYSFVPQVFAKAYIKAWTEYLKAIDQDQNAIGENIYLVIEEINRGNCAQIFGDIFQLLDRECGHSAYPIDIDSDFAKYIENALKNNTGIEDAWDKYKNKIQEWDSLEHGEVRADDDFCKIALPPNFNILATMNTSDQSLFPMDSAFKRRFDWEHVPIKYERDATCGTDWNADQFEISVGNSRYMWRDFLKAVNANVYKVTKSEDKQMGEFFIKHSVDYKEFRSKVLFYLWDSVYKDEEGNKDAEKVFHFRLEGEDDKTLTFQTLFEGNDETQRTRVATIMSNLGVDDQNAER